MAAVNSKPAGGPRVSTVALPQVVRRLALVSPIPLPDEAAAWISTGFLLTVPACLQKMPLFCTILGANSSFIFLFFRLKAIANAMGASCS
jgi:hypothetical protein